MEKSQNDNLLVNIPLKKRLVLLSGNGNWDTHALLKYQVPSITMNDGPAGLRKPLSIGETPEDKKGVSNNTYKATCFPSAALNACSWDPSLMEEFGAAIANECKAHHTNVILAPGVNIKRNPLGGRNFEYLSEDPILSGKMAASFIKGTQENGVGTCLKHFALNNQETRRFTYTAEVDDRTLHELYLKSFEIAIKEANPWMIMASYNRINGEYACANSYLLKDVLKGEWQYDGVVVSDWGAVEKVIESHKNGLDLEMPCFNGKDRSKVLFKAIKRGQLGIADVRDSAARIVHLTERCSKTQMGEKADYEKNHQLAVKMAEKSIVLTQNDGILPLHNYDDVCVIGSFAETPRIQAGGSSHVEEMHSLSFLDVINKGREHPVPYEPGYALSKVTEDTETAMNFDACDLASTHKKVILFLGVPESYESEGYDKETMRLPNEQYRLFENITALNNNVIVVLCSGSPVELSSISKAGALLITYLYGEGGSEALSNILLGLTNPSGKLAETWPIRYLDVPSSTFYPGNNDFSLYKESIFVGYRYYLTAGKKVQFPFGYGISYTNYKYSDMALSTTELSEGKKVSISLNVMNMGGRNGEETVQVYISALNSSLYREKRVLKAFNKTFIKAWAFKTIKMSLSYDDFAIWSRERKQFIVEDGDYLIEIGASSEDIRCSMKIHVSSPYKGAPENFKLPNYYSVSTKRPFSLVDDEFAYILGRDYVNDLPNKTEKKTLNSTFGDISDTKIGKKCVKMFKKQFSSTFHDEIEMEKQLNSFLNMPIRCGCMGGFNDRLALAIVALANHKYLKALTEFLKGRRK